jgi:uncharacterized protein YdaU (DUF1376 family)
MPLYVGDYLADTTHLTVTEHGAYLLLIMSFWRNETLPNDDKILARHARCTTAQWSRMKPTIMAFLEVRNDRVFHGRILHDLTAARVAVERQAQRSSNGGKATALKYKRRSAPEAEPQARQSKSTSSTVSTDTVEGAPRKRASRRAPPDWVPSDADNETLRSEGIGEFNRPSALARFKDHEFTKAKSDWSATYRNWIRKDAEDAKRNRPANGHDQRKQAAMDVLAERRNLRGEDQGRLADGGGLADAPGNALVHYERQPTR